MIMHLEIPNEIDKHIAALNVGDTAFLGDMYYHFLPTATFQEHAIAKQLDCGLYGTSSKKGWRV
jgi:hypothetical protein